MFTAARRIRELERQAQGHAQYAQALQDLLSRLHGVDVADELAVMSTRLNAIRQYAEELSALGLSMALDTAHPAQQHAARTFDRIGDNLRTLLDTPICVCGECSDSEE